MSPVEGNRGGGPAGHRPPPCDLAHCHLNLCSLPWWQVSSQLFKNFLSLSPQSSSDRRPGCQLCSPRGRPACGSGSAETEGCQPRAVAGGRVAVWGALSPVPWGWASGTGWEGLTGKGTQSPNLSLPSPTFHGPGQTESISSGHLLCGRLGNPGRWEEPSSQDRAPAGTQHPSRTVTYGAHELGGRA